MSDSRVRGTAFVNEGRVRGRPHRLQKDRGCVVNVNKRALKRQTSARCRPTWIISQHQGYGQSRRLF